jgi:hypothetical protein
MSFIDSRKDIARAELRGGCEASLDTLGAVLAWICGLAGLACIVIGLVGRLGDRWLWIAVGCGAILQGVIVTVLLSAAAEVIRLLKKQAGWPYSGKISEPWESPRELP